MGVTIDLLDQGVVSFLAVTVAAHGMLHWWHTRNNETGEGGNMPTTPTRRKL